MVLTQTQRQTQPYQTTTSLPSPVNRQHPCSHQASSCVRLPPGRAVCFLFSDVSSEAPVSISREPLHQDLQESVSQSFSLSRKRRANCVENQGNMRCERTLVKAPPASGRKFMSPTPQQSLQSSIGPVQLQTEVEDQESGSYERLMLTQDEEKNTTK